MLPVVYPDETILMEVGRVAIASGRLDAELSQVWWHLAPDWQPSASTRVSEHR
jgi:hypothetical protein